MCSSSLKGYNLSCGPEIATGGQTNKRTNQRKGEANRINCLLCMCEKLMDVAPHDAETCKCDTAYFMDYNFYETVTDINRC